MPMNTTKKNTCVMVYSVMRTVCVPMQGICMYNSGMMTIPDAAGHPRARRPRFEAD